MHRYKQFDHTADIGVEALGKTPKELFANAAFAVFDILTDLKHINPAVEKKIAVDGDGWEDLLINYLREILYLYNGEGLLLKEFLIDKIDERHLEGRVSGEPFDPARHRINTEIKAVTYHQAEVKEEHGMWQGRVIFDV
ncbi:MAG TPA: archease [Syntrophales bacterium]|nr:archease [Syntrophales bacterium]